MSGAKRLLGAHWYVPAFLAMLLAAWWLARTPGFMSQGGEAALLIDLCVTAPVVYLLCYARKQPLRVTALRALAIACSGVWIAGWLIPGSEQELLPRIAPLRWVGLAVVVAVEIWLVAAITRIAFSAKGTVDQIADASGAPAWVAKLMLWEANLWRSVWRFMGRR